MTDQTIVTCARLEAALDDVLDGRGPWTVAATDAHLAGCASCRALVADVRAIRIAAQTLGPIAPPPAVWTEVHARIADERPVHRAASPLDRLAAWAGGWGGLFQPLAATAMLVLTASSLAWMATRLSEWPATSGVPGAVLTEFALAEAEYSDAITSLEQAAADTPRGLDASTDAAVRASIDDLDQAIVEAREALAVEPGDQVSQDSLLDALGSKVALLQDTMALLESTDGSAEDFNR